MAKIIIQRKSGVYGSVYKFDVYLVNKYIGQLNNGETIETTADVGKHTLFFKNKFKIGKNTDKTFDVVVNDEKEVVELSAKFNLKGEFVIDYSDGAPHIPTFNDSNCNNNHAESQSVANPPAQTNNNLKCPKCGGHNLSPISETHTRGKNFSICNALCGSAVCLGPIGMLCGFAGKGKQLSTVTYWLCSDCGNKFKAK